MAPAAALTELKEQYRVWWAYLLYSEPFREYIRVTLHERRPLADLSRPAMRASHYYDPWVRPLLPDIFERYPGPADFPLVWQRVVVLSRAWRVSIETESSNHRAWLHHIFQQLEQGQLSAAEAAAQLDRNQQHYSIPRQLPKAEALRQIEQQLTEPDRRLDGILRPLRFCVPSHLGQNAVRVGSLETLQKNLTWYALTLGLSSEDDWQDLFDGAQVRYFDPPDCDGISWSYQPLFDSGTINFTGTHQERAIEARWKDHFPAERLLTPAAHRRKRTSSWRLRQQEVASFRHWALTCASAARETLANVANGWFPRPPSKSKKSKKV